MDGVDAGARIEHVRAGDEQVGRRGRRLHERGSRVEGAGHAIDGSGVGAGAIALPASTS